MIFPRVSIGMGKSLGVMRRERRGRSQKEEDGGGQGGKKCARGGGGAGRLCGRWEGQRPVAPFGGMRQCPTAG